jgi:histidinol-phosphatase
VNAEWRTRYELALEVGRQAGRVALRYFDSNLAVEWKEDCSPVTLADRETEAFLRARLQEVFPNDGFLGEESGDAPGSSGYRWVIDPIDGTRNFVRSIPMWATLVGVEFKGEQIAGVAEVPAMRLTYRALRGDGAYRGDRRLSVSQVDKLKEAILFYTSLTYLQDCRRDAFLELAGRVETVRGFGDFYGYMLVAQGSGELMVEHGVHPWDVAALKPIVEEAGGRFTNWDGGLDLHRPDVIVSNGKLHEDARRSLIKDEG